MDKNETVEFIYWSNDALNDVDMTFHVADSRTTLNNLISMFMVFAHALGYSENEVHKAFEEE